MATVLDELLTIYKFQQKGAEQVEGRVRKIQSALSSAGRGATVAGTGITTALAGVVKVLAGHETNLAVFAARTGQTFEQVQAQYGEAIEKIGQDTGVSFGQISEGFEKAYSGGIRGAELMEAVGRGAEFEAAGLGSMVDVLSTATTLANVFGMTTSDAIDLITKSATTGEGVAAEYATAWKNVASVGQAVGLTQEEVGAVLVTASQEMKSVTKAGNSFLQFLILFLRPTERAKKALEDFKDVNMDIESLQKRVRAGEFKEVYRDLQRLIASNPQMLGEILEGTEAMQAFLGVPSEKFEEHERMMHDRNEATREAFEQGTGTIERQLKRLLNNFKSFILDLGDTMRPTIDEMIQNARELMQEVRELSPEVKELVGQFLLLGPPLIIVGGALSVLSNIIGGIAALKFLGLKGALLSLGPIGVALAGIVTLLGLAVAHQEQLSEFFNGLVEKFGVGDVAGPEGGPTEEGKVGRAIIDFPVYGLEPATAAGLATPSGIAATAGGAAGPVSKSTSVNIEKVEVNTQATDPDGIARDIQSALEPVLQQTAEDYDSAIQG